MSAETIALILTAASIIITLGGGILANTAWILKRMDERFAQAEASVAARFDRVDARFEKVDERFEKVDDRFKTIDEQFQKVHDQFAAVRTEMTELRTDINDVKVSVARLEGPYPRLILPPQ